MPLGLVLRENRKKLGFKAEEVAEYIGIATPTVTRWENGSIDIKASDIERYCEAIGTTISHVFGAVNVLLPVLGTIRAGIPILAEDNIEDYLEVPDYMRADYVLKVVGDSMIGAGILDGDLAICREASTPQTGQIVVALRDDGSLSEATLKFYMNGNGHPLLRAANPDFADINYQDGYRCAGHMVALVRRDVPGYQIYKNYIAVPGYDEWTDVIELATSSGIKPEKMRSFIEMINELGKNK